MAHRLLQTVNRVQYMHPLQPVDYISKFAKAREVLLLIRPPWLSAKRHHQDTPQYKQTLHVMYAVTNNPLCKHATMNMVAVFFNTL